MARIDTSSGAPATGPATARPSAVPAAPSVLALTDELSRDPTVAGAKAANLARAASAGLPVLPGFVLRVGADPVEHEETLRRAWNELGGAPRPFVVRSSSVVEDLGTSSMAGRFTSVVGVVGWHGLLDAVRAVGDSAHEPDTMAVLVQPQVEARCGGVLFGMDPVRGATGRLLVEAVSSSPQPLVDGSVTGRRYVLSRWGRLLEADDPSGILLLDGRRARRLALLAARARRVFGGPQDIEWAEDVQGHLWLLQSRPITASGPALIPVGPLLGPGPVAETFPMQVRPLERDLWVAPLRAGIVEALGVAGAAPRRRILDSPVVTVIDGWVAADLELLGYAESPRRWWARLDPSGPLRHLLASWRVGRLRMALPDLAHELVDDTDVALHEVPDLRTLTDAELVQVLQRVRRGLVGLHTHEVLAGMLLTVQQPGPTAAALALRALAAGRARGDADADIVAREPVVLALTPPRLGPATPLPPASGSGSGRGLRGPEMLGPREALRLRIRWVQELGARAVAELARRWSRRMGPDEVPLLTLAEVDTIASGGTAPPGLGERRPDPQAPPLPASFRFTRAGTVTAAARDGEGRGAGGGRAIGPARHLEDLADLLPGDVLVVRNLSPDLASHLAGLGALVAETGNVLSHLAILAREAGVPTVVGVPQACERFGRGETVLVDGTAGTVERLEGRS